VDILRKGQAVEQTRFTFNAQPLLLKEAASTEPVELPVITVQAEDPALKSWVQELRAKGISLEGCELIRHHLAEGQYPEAYLSYVLMVLQKPRKAPIT
jgi:hypothetical protein